MKSDNGEIEVYLCPDVTTAKPKQHRTPIPPSDPLLEDVLQPCKPNFMSPVRAILTPQKAPLSGARRNLTFQNCSDSNSNVHSKVKDPVLHSVGMDGIVPKVEPVFTTFTEEQSCNNAQYSDLALDKFTLSPMNESLKRMFEEPSGAGQDTSETIRLKHALISESDDFGPMGGRYPLTIDDQHNTPGWFLRFTYKLLFLCFCAFLTICVPHML